jgi:protein SCO1/2
MNHRSAMLAVVMALGAVGYFAVYSSPLTKDLEAARENRWMNDVARDAMQQSELGSGSDKLKRVSARFPNTDLIDQHGRKLKFYDDLVKDTSVCIVFFYTRCTGSCPGTTTALKQIRRTIAQEFPNDEFRFISLTLEPDVDTPEELQEYMDRYRISDDPSLPEWVYATGDFLEVDHLRRQLGVYDLDPIIDADKTEHAAIVTFGNDRTDRWAALPVGMGVGKVSETIVRITGNTPRQRYANTLLVRHVTPKQSSTAAAADSCCSEKSKACCSKTAK